MSHSAATNIDEYIELFPEETQNRMKKIRKIIHDLSPGAIEEIRYKMASFKLKDGSYVYFAGFKNHISFFPFPNDYDPEGKIIHNAAKFCKTSGKGTIQFQNSEEMPYDLIKMMVKYWKTHATNKSNLY